MCARALFCVFVCRARLQRRLFPCFAFRLFRCSLQELQHTDHRLLGLDQDEVPMEEQFPQPHGVVQALSEEAKGET